MSLGPLVEDELEEIHDLWDKDMILPFRREVTRWKWNRPDSRD